MSQGAFHLLILVSAASTGPSQPHHHAHAVNRRVRPPQVVALGNHEELGHIAEGDAGKGAEDAGGHQAPAPVGQEVDGHGDVEVAACKRVVEIGGEGGMVTASKRCVLSRGRGKGPRRVPSRRPHRPFSWYSKMAMMTKITMAGTLCVR